MMNYKQKLKRNIKLSYLIAFLTELIFIIPIWVAFMTRVLSFSQAAFLTVMTDMLTVVLELPTGALADLIGRKKTVFLGWFVRGAGLIYIAFASSWNMFLLGGLICSLGITFISGADTALIYDSLLDLKQEDNYAQYCARKGFIVRIAIVLATFAGGYLYQIWIGLPYVLMGAMQIFSAFIVLFMQEPRIDSEKFSLKSYFNQTKIGFSQLLANKHMKKLSLFYVLVAGISWSCLYYFNQPFAKDVGFSEIEQGWLFGLIYFIVAFFLLHLAGKINFIKRKYVYLFFPLLMAVSLLPGLFANKKIAFFLLLGITLTGSARFAVLDQYVNKEILSKYRATAISSLNMIVSFFYIALIALSGRIQDIRGTKIIFTFLGALSLFVVLPAGISLVKEDKKYRKE